MKQPIAEVLIPKHLDRFWAKVDVGHPLGCWEWTANALRGYGLFKLAGSTHRAHRLAYQILVGPIPEGMHIDHLCRNPPCVNPDHLEPVTPAENVARGYAGSYGSPAMNRAKTHCPKGHPYSGNNLYVTPTGSRACKTCVHAAVRRGRERKRSKSSNQAA